ncbi:MAG: type II toxin-antitoxin system death-on-curing family toxin [Pseudolysinimonas sp.]
MTEYLALDDLLALCRDLGVQVRDGGLLHAAAERPTTTIYGSDTYPDLHSKAGALMQSLARNHALLDGNKRLAWLATVVFYGLNGMVVDAPDDEAYDLVIGVSTGDIDVDEIAARLTPWAHTSAPS